MNPVLKGILLTIGGLLLLFAAALAVIAATFDPNDYKDEIQAQAKAQTGRELTLGGPLSLTFFPWLGVRAEGLELANAEGFTDDAFARVAAVDVRLKLLPLLSRQIELGRVQLEGLELNLEQRADGSNNWEGLAAAEEAPAEEEAAEPAGELPALSVAGLAISDARITWRDAGALTVVEGLDLETGPIRENQASTLLVSVVIELADKTRLELRLESDWQFALSGPSASLTNLRANATASGGGVPGERQELVLAMDARYDGAADSAGVSNGRLEFAGQRIGLDAGLKELSGAMLADLALTIDSLDLARVARQLEIELPPEAGQWPPLAGSLTTRAELAAGRVPSSKLNLSLGELKLSADAVISSLETLAGNARVKLAPLDLHAFAARMGYPLALQQSAGPTALDADIALAADSIVLKSLKGQLAGQALGGNASLKDFAAPAIRADFDLAALTLKDWLPADSPAAQETKPADDGGSLNEMELPLEWAEGLNLTARAKIRQFNAYGLKFRDVLWTADGRPGQPVKQQLSANAYGGQLALSNSIDATKPKPVLGLDLSAKAVGLGEFLADGWGAKWITGTTELKLDLTGQGSTVGQLRQALNGAASYRLTDGEVQGFSLLDLVRKAGSVMGQAGASAESSSGSTDFRELVGRALIESGQLKMQDVGGGNQWLKFEGKGLIALVKEQYDMRLSPVLLKNDKTQSDSVLSKLAGLAIPIQVSGPLTAPKFKVDLAELAKNEAKARLEGKVEEKKDELREKLQDKFGDFLKSQSGKKSGGESPSQ